MRIRTPNVKGLYTATSRQERIRNLLPKSSIVRGEIPYSSQAIHSIVNKNAANPQAYLGAPFMGASRPSPRSAKDMAKRAARREELAAKRMYSKKKKR